MAYQPLLGYFMLNYFASNFMISRNFLFNNNELKTIENFLTVPIYYY